MKSKCCSSSAASCWLCQSSKVVSGSAPLVAFFFSVTTNKKKNVAFALLDVTADSTSGFFQTCSYWTAQKIPAQQHFQDLCSCIGKKKQTELLSFPFTPKFTRLFSCVQKSEKQQIPKKVG